MWRERLGESANATAEIENRAPRAQPELVHAFDQGADILLARLEERVNRPRVRLHQDGTQGVLLTEGVPVSLDLCQSHRASLSSGGCVLSAAGRPDLEARSRLGSVPLNSRSVALTSRPAVSAADHGWRRSAIAPLLALVVYTGLAVLINISVWLAPESRYIGLGGDPQQTMWFLTWIPFAITHGHNILVSNYINYPTGVNMLWQTSELGPGLLLSPVTALWGGVVTYNVLICAGFALGATFAFIAIRRYVPGAGSAAVGGLIYGFSPFMVAQAQGHLHLVVSGITPPLLLLLLDDILVRQRRKPWHLAALLTGLAVVQFFTSEEVLATEVIVAVIAAGVLSVMFHDEVGKHLAYTLRVIGPAAAASVVLLAYPICYQFLGPDRVSGVIHAPEAFATDPFNFIVPTSIQRIAPNALISLSARFTGNISEQDAYIGLPLVGLIGFAVLRYRRVSAVGAAGWIGGIVALLSLGGHLHVLRHETPIPLPWLVVEHIPVLVNLLPSRLMLYVFLPAGLIAAYTLSRVWGARRNTAAWGALALGILAPLLPRAPLDSQSLITPSYFQEERAGVAPGSVVATVPWPAGNSTEPMTWQAASSMRFRLLGGYIIGQVAPGQSVLRDTFTSLAGPNAPQVFHPRSPARFAPSSNPPASLSCSWGRLAMRRPSRSSSPARLASRPRSVAASTCGSSGRGELDRASRGDGRQAR